METKKKTATGEMNDVPIIEGELLAHEHEAEEETIIPGKNRPLKNRRSAIIRSPNVQRIKIETQPVEPHASTAERIVYLFLPFVFRLLSRSHRKKPKLIPSAKN